MCQTVFKLDTKVKENSKFKTNTQTDHFFSPSGQLDTSKIRHLSLGLKQEKDMSPKEAPSHIGMKSCINRS